MIYCLNPDCPSPQNPDTGRFCQACGWRLYLGDRYRAVHPLGQGLRSRTFLGWDTHRVVQSQCLIKGFTPEGRSRLELEEALDTFRKEMVQLDAVGQHPQIPDLLAYFERDRHQYFVQEFIQGETLEQRFKRQGTFGEAEILQVLQSVLPVLQFLHDHHIIHRDIKPTNLIQPPDRADWVLGDLGAAKCLSAEAALGPGTLIGSAEYAAPEQMQGQATFSSDLYSLGATCLHLLTGLSPFDLFDSIAGGWIWRSITVEISDPLAHVLDRLVQPNQGQRYAAVAEVIDDLHDLIDIEPIALVFPSAASSAAVRPMPHWHCAHVLSPPDDSELQIHSLAFSPDGQTLALGCSDRSIHLWDMETVVPTQSLTGHDGPVTALAFSPDGRMLASGSWDTTIRLWPCQTSRIDQPTLLNDHTGAVAALAFSPDSQMLVSGGRDRALKFWRLLDEKLLGSSVVHEAKIESLAISKTGQTLASGDASGKIKLWHLPYQELLRTLSGHSGSVSAIALVGQPPILINASWDMMLQCRNPDTGGILKVLRGHALPISAIALHPDGDTLVTSSHDGTIKFWSLATGKLLETLTVGNQAVDAIAFNPAGTVLASISREGTLRLWQCA